MKAERRRISIEAHAVAVERNNTAGQPHIVPGETAQETLMEVQMMPTHAESKDKHPRKKA